MRKPQRGFRRERSGESPEGHLLLITAQSSERPRCEADREPKQKFDHSLERVESLATGRSHDGDQIRQKDSIS